MQGERGLRTGRGARLVDGTARRGRHLLRVLQDDARLEIRETRSFNLDNLIEIKLKFAFGQEHAFESSQKYKEGKFIIELAHMIKDNGWDS